MLRNIRGREHTIEVLNWNIENLEALRQIIKCNEAGKIDSFQIEAQGQLRLVKVKGQDE